MKKFCCALLTALALPLFADDPVVIPHPKVRVNKVADFRFSGGIDHPAWKSQPSYSLMLYVTDVNAIGRAPVESGRAQFLYDDTHFYIRAHFTDSDVMTTANKNGEHFYMQGDLLEVFIKHGPTPYYWEIYGTPNKLHTRFYFTSRGTLGLPSGFALNDCPILVDAKVDGTFNDPTDKDRSWTVLVGVPRTELEKNGAKLGPGNRWLILAARYNYTRHLPDQELSSYPQITGGYHSHEYYAEMEFVE